MPGRYTRLSNLNSQAVVGTHHLEDKLGVGKQHLLGGKLQVVVEEGKGMRRRRSEEDMVLVVGTLLLLLVGNRLERLVGSLERLVGSLDNHPSCLRGMLLGVEQDTQDMWESPLSWEVASRWSEQMFCS